MVYLLHFSAPYKHVRHYIGVAPDLEALLGTVYEPAKWCRSPLLHAAHAAGVRFEIATMHAGDQGLARRWRHRKRAASLCSICRALAGTGAIV